jgi:hypothetical protein
MKFAHCTLNFSAAAAGLGLALLTQDAVAASPAVTFSHDLDLKFGYMGGAPTQGGGRDFGSIDELNSSVRYVLSPQVSRRVLLHFGLEWQRFSFGLPASGESAPIPNTLQQIDVLLGLDWQLNDKWLFRTELRPGVYSDFHDVDWNDVGAPFVLSAAYLANVDLQWVFGLLIDPRSNYPVIPALGVRWKFADQWTLRALLPEPRLEYELNERFIAYLGGGFDLGTYRLSDNFGDARRYPDLNRAMLDYFEVRVGPGFSWRIRAEIEIGANAGYMVYRRFDFGDKHALVSSDPAPYFQISCQLRF